MSSLLNRSLRAEESLLGIAVVDLVYRASFARPCLPHGTLRARRRSGANQLGKGSIGCSLPMFPVKVRWRYATPELIGFRLSLGTRTILTAQLTSHCS